MPEPDIEKGKKKKRRRSARVYVNANKPLAVPLDEIAGYFPSDEDDDDQPTPQHSEARARTRAMAKPDAEKAVCEPFPSAGSPIADARLSPSRVAGNASAAVDDHGGRVDPMNMPGPRELAFRHPHLRQSATNPVPLLSMGTNADSFPRDLSGMSIGIPVALSRLDAAAPTGLSSAPGNPASRLMPHIAQGSATGPNGGHSLADPARPPTAAMKASDRLAIMKQHMFPGSGGAR